MAVTFVFVFAMPLQYAVLAGAALSMLKRISLSSLDVHVVEVEIGDAGRARETTCPRSLADASVTVLDIYGSLFFAAAPKLKESLPGVGAASRPIVVLRLRGRGTLHSATIELVRDCAGDLAAGRGRLYLAGVGPEMEDQLRRSGLMEVLGADAVVPATDEACSACEIAQRRARTWLETHADGQEDPEAMPPV